MFYKKDVLKTFVKTTGKQRCQRLSHRRFPVNFAKLLSITFLQNTSGRLLLRLNLYLTFCPPKKGYWKPGCSIWWNYRKNSFKVPCPGIYTQLFQKIFFCNSKLQFICREILQNTRYFFLPPVTHKYVCLSGGKKCSFSGKIWRALFPWNTSFEIRPFALLPTKFFLPLLFAHFRVAVFLWCNPGKNKLN